MQQVTKTISITLDDRVILVDQCSPAVQELVRYYDDWRQEEVDTASKLLMIQAALRQQQQQLLATLQQEIAASQPKVAPQPEPSGDSQ